MRPRIGKARLQLQVRSQSTSFQFKLSTSSGNAWLQAQTYPELPTSQAPPLSGHPTNFTIDRFTSRNPPFYCPQQLKQPSSMSRRALTIGGLIVAGGAGYYLYSAGGDPRLAQ